MHLIIAPIVLPAVLAPIIAWVMRHDIVLARAFSIAGAVVMVVIAALLVGIASGGQTHPYFLGDWPAPFGIALALDRLSAAMVLLTTLLALAVVVHAAATGWDRRGQHFHALFQFQVMGLCGAFLTADAFNLFVFFEVLLIASYGLMIHGGGAERLRAGLQYVVMNLVGSALFLFALGTVYAATGTLNMADLAQKVAAMPAGDAALLRTGAALMAIVFALKAALVPVHFWLPATYARASAPVAALFAIMTKVGAYAILRLFTIAFPPQSAAMGGFLQSVLMPAALVTAIVGAVGVLGARQLFAQLSFAVIGSVGVLMAGIAAFTPEAASAALYYLLHSTLAAAVLFLLADLVVSARGEARDRLRPAAIAPGARPGLLAGLFLFAAIAMAGMPPLSGFLGKILVLQALWPRPDVALVWGVLLTASLLTIVGLARSGSMLFWSRPGAEAMAPGQEEPQDAAPKDIVPMAGFAQFAGIAGLVALIVALTVLAGPVHDYLGAAAAQLHEPSGYVDAILSRAQEGG